MSMRPFSSLASRSTTSVKGTGNQLFMEEHKTTSIHMMNTGGQGST